MKNLEEQLIGTSWSLKSFESVDQNDHIYYPLGEDAKGFIVFDHTGLFSVQLMAKEALSKDLPSLAIERMLRKQSDAWVSCILRAL